MWAAGAGRVLFAGVVRERATNDWTRMGNVVVVDHGGEVVTVLGTFATSPSSAASAWSAATGSGRWTDRLDAGAGSVLRAAMAYGRGEPPDRPRPATLSLPVEDLDARFVDPSAGLPADYPALERLPTGGAARPSGAARFTTIHSAAFAPRDESPRRRRSRVAAPTAR